MKKRNILFAVALFIFLAWLYFSNPISILNLISTARYEYIIIGVLFFFISIAIRAARWKLLLGDVGVNISFSLALKTLLAGMFISIYTPGRVAEPMRGYFLKEKTGIKISKVVSLILIEKVIDLIVILAFSLLIFTALKYEFSNEISIALRFAPFVAGAIVASMLALLIKRSFGEKLLEILYKFTFFRKHSALMKTSLESFYDSTQLLKRKTIVVTSFLTIIIWSIEGCILLLSVLALGQNIPLIFSVGIMSLSQIIGLISSLPGGLGSVEAVLTALLFSSLNDIQISSTATLIYRISTLWLVTILGFVVLATFFKKSPKKQKEQQQNRNAREENSFRKIRRHRQS